MAQNASRAAALYDQFEDEQQVADWGGDELFTRMPRPRAVDDAPPPRFRPEAPDSAAPATERSLTLVAPADDRPSRGTAGEEAMLARAERLGISLVEPDPRRDGATGRRSKLITGHPDGAPRPLPMVRADRHRRPSQTPADWIGPRPERLVGWAFALGLVLILIAILTA